MYTVTKHIDFCYGHRLMNYDGMCKHLHGHNGRIEVELASDSLDERGMVVDFTEVNESVKAWVDANLDHKMLLRKDDPIIPILEAAGEPYYAMETNPTAEAIARLVYDYVVAQNFPVRSVSVWETPTSVAVYSPTEG